LFSLKAVSAFYKERLLLKYVDVINNIIFCGLWTKTLSSFFIAFVDVSLNSYNNLT